jgi:hypothetical protein
VSGVNSHGQMSTLQSRIDDAFHRALSNDSSRPIPTNDASGGFLLNDDGDLPGGFFPPSPPAVALESDGQPSHIPLSHIPYALQLLDLPPDDEEVLAVFHNAATGWGEDYISSRLTAHGRKRDSTTTGNDDDMAQKLVSLKDWRAVCTALMDDGGDVEGNAEGNAVDGEDPDAAGEDPSSELDESSDRSSDEYRVTDARSRKRSRKSAPAGVSGTTRRTRARKTQSETARGRSPLSPSTSADITPRQKRECLRTFLLFFPSVPEEVAKRKRLGVREVNAAATLLNEKIKTEEVRPLTVGPVR